MTTYTVQRVPSPTVELTAIRDLMKGHLKVVNRSHWKLGLDDILAQVEKYTPLARLRYNKDSGELWADVNEEAHHITDYYATRQKKIAAYDRMSFIALTTGTRIHDVGLNFFRCYPIADKTTPEARNFSMTIEVAPIVLDTLSQGCIVEFTGSYINLRNEHLLFGVCTLRVTETTYYRAKNGKLNRVKGDRTDIQLPIEVY